MERELGACQVTHCLECVGVLPARRPLEAFYGRGQMGFCRDEVIFLQANQPATEM